MQGKATAEEDERALGVPKAVDIGIEVADEFGCESVAESAQPEHDVARTAFPRVEQSEKSEELK